MKMADRIRGYKRGQSFLVIPAQAGIHFRRG
jgi:hypothetical protein